MGENRTYAIEDVWVAPTNNGNGVSLQEIARLADEIEAIDIPGATQLVSKLREGLTETREKTQKKEAAEKLPQGMLVSC